MNKKLYRDEYHRVIGGVCAGLAEYFEMDVTIVRLLFILTTFIVGTAIVAYIILWIVLPRKGYSFNNFNNPTVDYRVLPQQPSDSADSAPGSNTPPPASPYGKNPFASAGSNYSSFENRPFTNSPLQNEPFAPAKQASNAGVIVGVVLIIVGGIILADNYDWIPDFDFTNLWPLAIIIPGAILLVSGMSGNSSRQANFQNADAPANSTNDNPPATEEAAAKEE